MSDYMGIEIIKYKLEALIKLVELFETLEEFKELINVGVFNDFVESCKVRDKE